MGLEHVYIDATKSRLLFLGKLQGGNLSGFFGEQERILRALSLHCVTQFNALSFRYTLGDIICRMLEHIVLIIHFDEANFAQGFYVILLI